MHFAGDADVHSTSVLCCSGRKLQRRWVSCNGKIPFGPFQTELQPICSQGFLLSKEYAISWEVMVHPRNPKIAAIKLWPNSNSKSRAPSPGRYSEGVHLFREAVAKRYVIQRKNQRIKQMSVSSLSAPMRLSVQEQRAAEKEKSLAKKKKHSHLVQWQKCCIWSVGFLLKMTMEKKRKTTAGLLFALLATRCN